MTRSRDIADQQDNLGGAVAPFVAGKNRIINGDFSQWQRGTSFAFTAATNYTADRFTVAAGVGGTVVVTQQAFTPGTAPVAGYEAAFFLNANYTTSGASVSDTGQHIEDVRTFAGQTITVSVWARVSTGTHQITPQAVQRFGTGGSTAGATNGANWILTTDWQRFSSTIAVPSVAGKTIGAGSSLQIRFESGTSGVKSFSFWGFQTEGGNVATPFTPAGGGFPGAELALCQRYYQRLTATSTFGRLGFGMATGTTNCQVIFPLKTTMRTSVTALDFSGTTHFVMNDGVSNTATNTAPTLDSMQNPDNCLVVFTAASGLTAFRPYNIAGNNNATAYIGFSAEL